MVSQTQNFWVVVDYGSQPGSCDAPTPPCKERAGCHLQFYIVYANNSSSPVYVVITPPGGGHVTARVDPNSAEGWECESAEPRAPSPEPEAESRYARLLGLLRCIAGRQLPRSDVEDVVSQVLLELLTTTSRLRRQGEEIESPVGMAITIMQRRVLSWRRWKSSYRVADEACIINLPSHEQRAWVAPRIPESLVKAMLSGRGTRQRTVLVTILEGGSVGLAAERLGGLPRKEVLRIVRGLTNRAWTLG